MFEYLNTKIQCYTQANDASEKKKKCGGLKKTLVRETKKKEKYVIKFTTFFPQTCA